MRLIVAALRSVATLVGIALYVAILVFATAGQLFHVDAILNLFDLKKVFSV